MGPRAFTSILALRGGKWLGSRLGRFILGERNHTLGRTTLEVMGGKKFRQAEIICVSYQ